LTQLGKAAANQLVTTFAVKISSSIVAALELLKLTLLGDVVVALLGSYKEIERNFVLGKWKPSELDGWSFCGGS
jgi:hypothetical protein